jgi:hypothetical protein
MSDKWEIEREKPCYVIFADSLVCCCSRRVSFTLRLLDRFEFFFFRRFSFFSWFYNKAAMMITFDPIDEFIDSKKQTFKSKIKFFFLAPKCLKMIQTAGSFPGRCVFSWPFNLP